MKNIVGVDIDSSRKDSPIEITKSEEFDLKKMTNEEWADSVILDMASLCEGICTLIHVADQHGIKTSADSLRDCIKHLQDGFADASYIGRVSEEK